MSDQNKLDRLESLMERIGQMEEETPSDYTETEKVVDKLEQILLKVEAIHEQKAKQQAANDKLERLLSHMESTIGDGNLPQDKPEKTSIQDTLKGFLQTAQSSGKVLELLAGSLLIVLEAAVKVVQSNDNEILPLDTSKSKPQPDFSSLLATLNSYVQNMSSSPGPGK